MVSRSVGQTIIDEVVNGEARLQFITDVDNGGMATIRVVCGIIEGKSESLVIFGAHHDTVYNGQGAVDDTSGVATVQEIARQFGLLESSLGMPEMTLYFCTWGGEEEGLWGSKEWVDKHRNILEQNLRLYINLDMNHVDIDLETRGNSLWMFGNDARDHTYLDTMDRFNEESLIVSGIVYGSIARYLAYGDSQ